LNKARQQEDRRSTCINDAPGFRSLKFRSAKFPEILSRTQRPSKKPPHPRTRFKACATARIHIREQPATESTALSRLTKRTPAAESFTRNDCSSNQAEVALIFRCKLFERLGEVQRGR
jgi:hypothetical protein